MVLGDGFLRWVPLFRTVLGTWILFLRMTVNPAFIIFHGLLLPNLPETLVKCCVKRDLMQMSYMI